MQNIFAYLMATVVAGILLLAIFKIRIDGDETSVAVTQFRASKSGSLNVAAMIQRDFANIASNHPNFVLPLDSVFVAIDTVGSEQSFSFRGQTARGAAPSLISYQWEEVGTTYLDTSYVPTYRLTRYVDGVNSGGSTGGIVEFRLRFLREDGMAVANVINTRQIEVELRSVSTLGKNKGTKGTRWSATIRPTALQIEA